MSPILLTIALSQASPLVLAPRPATDGPAVMTAAEIRTYNARLARTDPAYIRCQRTLQTGSLVKKNTSCRTNAEWRRVQEIGNQDARDLLETIQSHTSTHDAEPAAGPQIGG